ncbi:sporulation integral membrane protein YtvI [Crassaminicella profunda]|uniref:sporulation integral membrane protein YtvI n=1 Tax=Crassaminicella profunda TaxID=1286698 RepID=UPI001CA6963C|nr:sporulation integral membrane protein YtvI [Crassaminicella profunda]QZY56144.1 sporulation integral membrane protein YtvI [Crassaminicella profunda]
MNNSFEKYLPIVTRILILCFIVLGLYFISTTLIFYVLPFILSWIMATILEPPIHFLSRVLKLSRNLSTLLIVSFFVLFIGLVMALIGGIIIVQLTNLSMELSQYPKKLYLHSSDLVRKMEHLYIGLPPDIAQSMINGINGVFQSLTSLIGKFISSLLSFISAIPSFFTFLMVTILSTFFMARDKHKIKKFIKAQLPTNALSKSILLKDNLIFALMGYIKAQLILMLITFVESTIGLTAIGIDYSLLIAFFASIIDALPILGTGCVYVPLILWKLLMKSYKDAFSLTLLYGIIILIRQLLEPKILGSQIGLYPLATLMSMYIGLKLFGILGLILGPISLIFFITLQKVELFPKWKNK